MFYLNKFRFKMSISSTPQTAAIPENHSVVGLPYTLDMSKIN